MDHRSREEMSDDKCRPCRFWIRSVVGGRDMTKRILVVDDHDDNKKIMRDLLGTADYETMEAGNGEQAVTMVAQRRPDLILMDIQLTGMDGITAMKQLKAAPKTNRIPIVAITASAMTHNRQTMLAEGFDGYQTKPISLKDFLGEVERVLANRGS